MDTKSPEEYELTPEVIDHIETYKLYLDDWNSDKPYEPSLLFGGIDKIRRWLQLSEFENPNVIIGCLCGGFVLAGIVLAMILI